MICKNCGCYISFLLDECPGCGEPKYMSETPKQSNINAYGAASATYTTGGAAASASHMNSATAEYACITTTAPRRAEERVRVLRISQRELKAADMFTVPMQVYAEEAYVFEKDIDGTMIRLQREVY